jgi:hypothetical protein
VFLARGSLSLAAGRTHLEFVVRRRAARCTLRWPRSACRRRARAARPGVLTWKGAETWSRFLRRAGARRRQRSSSSRARDRSLRGHLNRVLNAETPTCALGHHRPPPAGDIEALERRRAGPTAAPRSAPSPRAPPQAPEATFSELAAGLGTSRALVQRAFEQIEARPRARKRPSPPAGPIIGIRCAR